MASAGTLMGLALTTPWSFSGNAWIRECHLRRCSLQHKPCSGSPKDPLVSKRLRCVECQVWMVGRARVSWDVQRGIVRCDAGRCLAVRRVRCVWCLRGDKRCCAAQCVALPRAPCPNLRCAILQRRAINLEAMRSGEDRCGAGPCRAVRCGAVMLSGGCSAFVSRLLMSSSLATIASENASGRDVLCRSTHCSRVVCCGWSYGGGQR